MPTLLHSEPYVITVGLVLHERIANPVSSTECEDPCVPFCYTETPTKLFVGQLINITSSNELLLDRRQTCDQFEKRELVDGEFAWVAGFI